MSRLVRKGEPRDPFSKIGDTGTVESSFCEIHGDTHTLLIY